VTNRTAPSRAMAVAACRKPLVVTGAWCMGVASEVTEAIQALGLAGL